ncbi:YHS domain-containing (seleno)protein [Fluviibacterium sp. DFM31]|uniref:YHS domain-containing (Seleno)protein n=1 Tax=Meridianimarinicoccus marinus TaxID=3231483 RepID=A0ABV3L803_9RHOB
MFRSSLLALAFSAAATSALWAGEQFIDETGYAVSGYDVVSYWGLDQVAVGQSQPSPEKGRTSLTADYNGATFAFASEANRAAFLADPEKYLPQYDGHCAYGVAKGGKVPGNPTLWRIVDGKLYLNITKTVVGFWEEDIPGNLQLSESNWVGLEPAPASDSTIPKWSSDAPQVN